MSDDTRCGKKCDHGSQCQLAPNHVPSDCHETEHGCIFYDIRADVESAASDLERQLNTGHRVYVVDRQSLQRAVGRAKKDG